MRVAELCEACTAVKPAGRECFYCRARRKRRDESAAVAARPVKKPAAKARRAKSVPARPIQDSERLGRYDARFGLPRAERRRFGRGRAGDRQFAAYEAAYEKALTN